MGANNTRLYVVGTDSSRAETEALSEVKPPRLLLSFFYFRTKGLRGYLSRLGYKPEILLDSGAFSAYSKGRNISLIDYIDFIRAHEEVIDRYIALDVIGDPDITQAYYEIMRSKGISPIPVFHFGGDFRYLDYYVERGETLIALGGSAMIRNKQTVAAWIAEVNSRYPSVEFHLLGSSSRQITDSVRLYSCDSSTWILQAINGNPKHIKGKTADAKKARAVFNLRELLEVYA